MTSISVLVVNMTSVHVNIFAFILNIINVAIKPNLMDDTAAKRVNVEIKNDIQVADGAAHLIVLNHRWF